MIRNLVVSIWILSLTLLSAYLGATVSFHSLRSSPPAGEEGPSLITLKSITVPVIANGTMQGYVLASVTLTVKRPLLKKLPQPTDLVLANSVFKTLYAEEPSRLQACRNRTSTASRKSFWKASMQGREFQSWRTFLSRSCIS